MSFIATTCSTKCSTLVRPLAPRAAAPPPEAFEYQLATCLRAVAPAHRSIVSRLVTKATSWIDRVRGLPKRVIELPAAPPPSRAASLTVPLIFVTSEEEYGAVCNPVVHQQRVKTVRPQDGMLVVPRVCYGWQWNPEADVLSDLPQCLAQPDLAYLDDSLDSIPEELAQAIPAIDVDRRLSDMDALLEMLRVEMTGENVSAEEREDEGSWEDSDETVRMHVPVLEADDGDSPVLGSNSMPVTPMLDSAPAVPTTMGDDESEASEDRFDIDMSAEQEAILKVLDSMWSGAGGDN